MKKVNNEEEGDIRKWLWKWILEESWWVHYKYNECKKEIFIRGNKYSFDNVPDELKLRCDIKYHKQNQSELCEKSIDFLIYVGYCSLLGCGTEFGYIEDGEIKHEFMYRGSTIVSIDIYENGVNIISGGGFDGMSVCSFMKRSLFNYYFNELSNVPEEQLT